MSTSILLSELGDSKKWPHTTEDGSKAIDLADGNRLYLAPNNTKTWTNRKGETWKQEFPDGTIIEVLENSGKKQTNPDGSTITQLRNGTHVQVKGDVKITKMPIGIIIEENFKLKYKATKFPDGYEMIEQADGITIDRAPDGTTKVTHADGLEVETFEDGSKRIKLPTGKFRFVPPPEKVPQKIAH